MKSSQTINILIDNCGAENLGAWLMAESVIRAINDGRRNKFRFAFRQDAFKKRNENGRVQVMPGLGYQTAWIQEEKLYEARNLAHLISKMLRGIITQVNYDQMGLVPNKKIRHIIDVGGYWLGSPWENSANHIKKKTLHYQQITRRGGKVILMPQAFGSFDKHIPEHQELFQAVTKVYVRDEQSYQNLMPICDSMKITKHPDFTFNIKPDIRQESGSILIIPNIKLMEKGGMGFTELVDFYVAIFDLLRTTFPDKKIKILNHAGSKDQALCNEICLLTNVDLVNPTNPFEAKSIISQAFLCISGRYHGIINSLYTNTPVIGTSWSHKYELLFAEYNLSEMLISPNKKGIISLQKIFTSGSVEDKTELIKKRNLEIRTDYNKIWADLLSLISE